MRLLFFLLTFLLILSASAAAIQRSDSQFQQSDAITDADSPGFPLSVFSTMPPDMAAPPPKEVSNTAIELRIRGAFANEERFIDRNVSVVVTDDNVVLDGEVSDLRAKNRLNQVAAKFSQGRAVADNMRVQKEVR